MLSPALRALALAILLLMPIARAVQVMRSSLTEFLLMSFDTKRDMPEVLAAFRKKEKLPVANWTLLRGSEDDVRELAALLGINCRGLARAIRALEPHHRAERRA